MKDGVNQRLSEWINPRQQSYLYTRVVPLYHFAANTALDFNLPSVPRNQIE